jgi:hypothetical protein
MEEKQKVEVRGVTPDEFDLLGLPTMIITGIIGYLTRACCFLAGNYATVTLAAKYAPPEWPAHFTPYMIPIGCINASNALREAVDTTMEQYSANAWVCFAVVSFIFFLCFCILAQKTQSRKIWAKGISLARQESYEQWYDILSDKQVLRKLQKTNNIGRRILFGGLRFYVKFFLLGIILGIGSVTICWLMSRENSTLNTVFIFTTAVVVIAIFAICGIKIIIEKMAEKLNG